ncbi:MAG: response regulator, partial [Sphingomonadales bacterium]
ELDRVGENGLRSRFGIEADPHPVLDRAGDDLLHPRHQLGLLNLILNARDAMPDGGELAIILREHRLEGRDDVEDGDYLGITVTDTGAGIDPDLLPRVFEPFFTTKEFGRGSGLGLSMVFGMARQSGGMVQIESTLGAGTSVTIFLRLADAVRPPQDAPRLAASADLQQLVGLKILVVDDEPIVREVVAEMLKEMGCTVVTAEDGRQAIELAKREDPTAMLLDFAMPGMNGAEVARAVLADQPGMRIVFATGFAQYDAIDGAVGDDAIVLRKPFSPGTLAESLRRALIA